MHGVWLTKPNTCLHFIILFPLIKYFFAKFSMLNKLKTFSRIFFLNYKLSSFYSETFCANNSMYEFYSLSTVYLYHAKFKFYMHIFQNLTLTNMAHNIIKIVHSTAVTQCLDIYVKISVKLVYEMFIKIMQWMEKLCKLSPGERNEFL